MHLARIFCVLRYCNKTFRIFTIFLILLFNLTFKDFFRYLESRDFLFTYTIAKLSCNLIKVIYQFIRYTLIWICKLLLSLSMWLILFLNLENWEILQILRFHESLNPFAYSSNNSGIAMPHIWRPPL